MASYLETVLTTACPSFAREWAMLRQTYPSDAPPSANGLLVSLRAHVEQCLGEGRVVEVVRLFYALERLLGEADPVLEELLVSGFVAPLALACRAAGLDLRLVLPHLGPRTRGAWDRALLA